MTEIIIVEIIPNIGTDANLLRNKIQELIKKYENEHSTAERECHSIRAWVEKRSDIK